MNFLKEIYANVPDDIKKIYSIVPFSLRAGRGYSFTLSSIARNQFVSKSELELIQFNKLKELLIASSNNVEYYSELFEAARFNPFKFSELKEIEALPLLDRMTVFNNYERMKNRSTSYLNSYEGYTGGTTGNPLKILFDIKSHFIEWAYIHAMWKRVGFSARNRRVSLLGVPFRKDAATLWKHNYPHNELQLSPRHMTDETMNKYIELITDFKADYIYGLPSAITVLAQHIQKLQLNMLGIKGILCGSENMTQRQRELISDTFAARVYTWYGQTEKVVLGGECEFSEDYHLFPEYGYTELIDERGEVIYEAGRAGEIVGTGFINQAMPLIRYRTGDFAEYVDGACRCRRNYPRLKRVVGRRDPGKLHGKDGTSYLFSSIETQKGVFDKIFKCQFIQEKPGFVVLNLMSSKTLSESDLSGMALDLASQVDQSIQFEIRVVNDLIRTENGKTPSLIQKLDERRI